MARSLVDRHRVVIAPGAITRVRVYGVPTVAITATGDAASARYDEPARSIVISGLHPGVATFDLRAPDGGTDTIAVAVLLPAGVVPGEVRLVFAGTPSREFALRRARSEIRRSACPSACAVTLSAPVFDTAAAGGEVDVGVRVTAPNASDVAGTTRVHWSVVPLAAGEPARLLYSDDPETVRTDGTLFRSSATIDAAHPARIYAYHAAADEGRDLFITLRAGPSGVQVQLVGASVGPSGDISCAGHALSALYLNRRGAGSGFVLQLDPGATFVMRVNARRMAPGNLAAAFYDIRVSAGAVVETAVISTRGNDPLAVAPDEIAGDGHDRRGEYDLAATAPVALRYAVGDSQDASRALGAGGGPGELGPLRPGSRRARGEYGVVRRMTIDLANPSASAATVFLYLEPVQGGITASFAFDGEPQALEVPRLGDPNARVALRTFTLAPGERRVVGAAFTPDGGSNYPIELGVTASPPPALAGDLAACYQALDETIQ